MAMAFIEVDDDNQPAPENTPMNNENVEDIMEGGATTEFAIVARRVLKI